MIPFTLLAVLSAAAPDASPAARGQLALTRTAFIPAFWPRSAYDDAWKAWPGTPQKPADYAAALNDRYGLHPAPYPNDGLPMGLRLAPYLPLLRGIGIDCLTCHGSSMFGKGVVGLGNASLDIQAIFEEFAAAAGVPAKVPFTFTQTRGTNEAGAFSVYLLGLRNDDLTLRGSYRDLGLHDDACEDVPAWWLLKKKRTMYYVGATDTRSVRSLMQFMMHPLARPADFAKAEPAFRDIRAYLDTLEPPKYPFPVDGPLAAAGKQVFADNCTKCHGTYGPDGRYPNRVIPLDEIGTDPKRHANIGAKFGEAYNASWFAQERPTPFPVTATAGYQAPPLDGVWATAPYFHNGSVPTLAGVLDSTSRPKRFTRSFRTAEADYDAAHVGWRTTAPTATTPLRQVYDTALPGRSNAGHTYGDALTDAERRAVIEYLKTL